MCKDYLLKALVAKDFVALVATTTNLVNEAREMHRSSPTATVTFGRLLSLSSIMTGFLREKERISLQIISRGPIKEIFSQGDWRGNVRGYIRWPHINLPPKDDGRIDVEGALGHGGMLYVVRDFGRGEPQWGAISLKTGGVAKDLAYYFTLSEGIPSAVGAGVYVGMMGEVLGSGGFIIQPLPGSDPLIGKELEKNIKGIGNMSEKIAEGACAEDILKEIAGTVPVTHLEVRSIRYKCSCSRSRAQRVLRLLGEKEIMEMICEDGGAEVVCQFCGSKYYFIEKELMELLKRIGEEATPQ